ncbi:flagellar motor stator protein MotA [Gilliamella sp. B2776]|uniref:flagellar motor stator protein MotA n=1 Tax=unclassified Gilliamella TaxID=2685620 RepID=UPI00226AF890|nr:MULTISPECIES: flagellar motor stator protein MotA [unclassified Gilliamella]MCX8650885.1 flagellar motor stator protein MotA [Gilliamella sp. B2779]MCX8654132.1 flagellar motor stator protein MotA [Gilliamella sp. B2737]MCX8657218.1 flagellar motor stator protein MotA [Gilliamella sp. B2894]MCX8665859.1 flagellar motor stator protein MotA [Gilliamella sp. B2887]MCX8692699.1 flagellar motor stator protein MotA [Gilliamella sp. B2776]
MLIIIGYIVVIASALVGYVLSGGYLAVLFQPLEFLIIGGTAIGAFIVSNEKKVIKATLKALGQLFKSSKYNKTLYLTLINLMYTILTKIRQNGTLSIESDIDNPKESELFKKYPIILANPQICDFITDYLRLMISGNMDAFEIEALMNEEIETYTHELEKPADAISSVGDGLPAFGIVAAVMGVINTLAQADRPASELGELIAHAMVGTFLGILLAYGFVSPLAALLKQRNTGVIKTLECTKVILIASMHDYAPQICIEFGRKTLFSHERPSFFELEKYIQDVKDKNANSNENNE